MTAPCQIGLKCPYKAYSEDADLICTYPKTQDQCEEGEIFSFVDDVDCEIMEEPSLLSDFIRLKDSIERGTCPTEERIREDKLFEEFQEHREEGHKRVNRKTEVVLYRRNITEDVSQKCGILEGEAEGVLDYLRAEIARVKLEDDVE